MKFFRQWMRKLSQTSWRWLRKSAAIVREELAGEP
jgi:hypothetical protein